MIKFDINIFPPLMYAVILKNQSLQ